MPLVRIDISKTASCERVRDVGDAVCNAMIAVANVPNYDKFQVVTRHEPDEIIYPEEGDLGIDYTPDLIIIRGHPGRQSLDRSKEEVLSAHRRRNSRQAGRAQAGHLDQPGRFRPRGLVVRQWRDAVRPEVTAAEAGRQGPAGILQRLSWSSKTHYLTPESLRLNCLV
jgi:hypothetical protein